MSSVTFWSVMECYSWLCFGVGYLVTTLVLLYFAFLLFDATAWTVVSFIYFMPRRSEIPEPIGFFRYWFWGLPMHLIFERFFRRLWGSSSGAGALYGGRGDSYYEYIPPFKVRKIR